MLEKDFDKKIKEIAKRAKNSSKQELTNKRVSTGKKKSQKIADSEPKDSPKQKDNTIYTAIIIASLEYEGVNVPSKEQLAEDLGSTIIKWADQKGFYAIESKAPVPKLVSIDVDIK